MVAIRLSVRVERGLAHEDYIIVGPPSLVCLHFPCPMGHDGLFAVDAGTSFCAACMQLRCSSRQAANEVSMVAKM